MCRCTGQVPYTGAATDMADLANKDAQPTELPFKYLGGDLSLDFVNTVDWASHGLVNERLTTYEHLTRWAEGAGLLRAAEAGRLRTAARMRPRAARIALERATRLREVLQRLFTAVAARTPDWRELEAFNRAFAEAMQWLRVAAAPASLHGARRVDWAWQSPAGRLDALLSPVIWSAARLVTSPEAACIRRCASPQCRWMYIDRSRNGLRRWCAMETCGTTEKTRRRRERHRRSRAVRS